MTPKYALVRQELTDGIVRGRWAPGTAIPSEAELCEQFDVSRTTIRKAVGELVYAGRLLTVQGKGTFVAGPKVEQRFVQRAFGIYEDLDRHGVPIATRILRQDVVPAPREVARRLQLPSDTPTHLIVRFRSVANEPLLVSTTYIPYGLCPGLDTADLSHGSLYALLRDSYRLSIHHGERRLEAIAAATHEARLLEVALASPLLLLESVAYTQAQLPFEHSVALQRADRTKFEFTFGHPPTGDTPGTIWSDRDSDWSAADLIGDALAVIS